MNKEYGTDGRSDDPQPESVPDESKKRFTRREIVTANLALLGLVVLAVFLLYLTVPPFVGWVRATGVYRFLAGIVSSAWSDVTHLPDLFHRGAWWEVVKVVGGVAILASILGGGVQRFRARHLRRI